MLIYIATGLLFLIILYFFITYNSLTKLQNRVEEAFSTMDVYLKKRWDLIPNIVEAVRGYANHENQILKEIMELRNNAYDSMNNNDKVDTNNQLTNEINRLMALVESYPELRADENFRDLSKQLTRIEDEIANARKYYNGTVRLMNNKVEMFPSNIVARLLGYKTLKMFEASANERESIKVEL